MSEEKNYNPKDLFLSGTNTYLPSVSIDCVVFGFHNGIMKILLNKLKSYKRMMLPGGFILIDEDVDSAAHRILKERTGLGDIYLKQFHLFGDHNRTNIDENRRVLHDCGIDDEKAEWFLRRFVSVGYYAFADYSQVQISTASHEEIKWVNIDEIPDDLYSDHNIIINKALSTIRAQIGSVPIGYELLPEKFTATELRIIYETILDKKLDRRNFQKKILSSGLIYKLDEVSKKWGIKSTALFSFDKEKYKEMRNNEAGLH